MNINVSVNPQELGKVAGAAAAELIRKAVSENGTAHIILATGTSQFGDIKPTNIGTGY
ncbi:MAG: hypothetical protein WKG06_31795 [Segetibacter sp.]